MSAVTSILDKTIFAILSPFAALPWGVSLLISSLIFSAIFVFAYRAVSSQKRIKAARNSIRTAILEAVVFRRDAKVCLRAQAALFWGGLRYLGLAIIPVAVLLVPGTILISRMYLAIGIEPLKAGSTFLVHGKVENPSSLSSLEVTGDERLSVGPLVRSPRDGEFVARVAVTNPVVPSNAVLTVRTASSTPSGLPVKIDGADYFPRELTSRAKWDSILLPAGQLLFTNDGSVTSMWIQYPERMLSIFGHQVSWLVLFVILTLAWGYGVARAFGIAI